MKLLCPRRLRQWFFFAAAVSSVAGCAVTSQPYWEALKGDGFPGWSENLASATRGNGVGTTGKSAEASGFFTDRRSEQIEKNLGGGF